MKFELYKGSLNESELEKVSYRKMLNAEEKEMQTLQGIREERTFYFYIYG